MATALTTTALSLHDLGLATSFGGTLFGKVGLDLGAKVLGMPADRGRVVSAAWSRFGIANSVALGISAASWFIGRGALSGREVSRKARPWVLAKDVLWATTMFTAIGNMVSGALFARQAPGGSVPIEHGMKPSDETPKQARLFQRLTSILGIAHLIAVGGVIVTTSVLNQKAGRSLKWKAVARLLP